MPFTPGRTDASQDDTDVDSFKWLEPDADGFRNYVRKFGAVPTEHLLIDKAFMLNLTAPQMTALVGGLRVIGNNVGEEEDVFEGRDRSSGDLKWTATRVDLVFGANSQLRALVEEFAAAGGEDDFVRHFVAGWVKVMENDRFDLR